MRPPRPEFIFAIRPAKLPSITAFEKGGLTMTLSLEKVPDSDTLSICMTASNGSGEPMSEFLFQAAVPKTFQLQMLSPSGSIIPPAGQITQVLRVTNPNKVGPIEMRGNSPF